MSWSSAKEQALRSLRPIGDEYAVFLERLSDVRDENVPAVVEDIRAGRGSTGYLKCGDHIDHNGVTYVVASVREAPEPRVWALVEEKGA